MTKQFWLELCKLKNDLVGLVIPPKSAQPQEYTAIYAIVIEWHAVRRFLLVSTVGQFDPRVRYSILNKDFKFQFCILIDLHSSAE